MGVIHEIQSVLKLRVLRLLALSCLLSGLVALSFLVKTFIRDPDIWWHLKVGDWILQRHAVPHVGIFSRTAANRPWMAYSWGYEVMLSRAYAWFGLTGIALFGVLLTIAVAWVFFWVLHRLSGSFWTAWVLCAAGCYAFLFSVNPRPVFFSMPLFAIVLLLILHAQKSCSVRRLSWLPLIFFFWANLHIQFIYGLFLFGLFVGTNLLQRIGEGLNIRPAILEPPTLPLLQLVLISAACLLATLLTPYSIGLYRVVFEYSKSQVPYLFIEELQAPGFQHMTDYVLVLLTAAGFYAVALRRKLDLFKTLLMFIAAAVAFRTSRDAWFVCIPAAAFIADAFQTGGEQDTTFKLSELAALSVCVVLLLSLVARNTDFTPRDLDRTISREYPVNAVNYLRRNPVPGPLYNDLDWGGFLTWYAPNYLVSIDGRNDLYGDELDLLSFNTLTGQSYTSDPYLNEAGVILLHKTVPLATLLRQDTRFRLFYEDELAIMFVRR